MNDDNLPFIFRIQTRLPAVIEPVELRLRAGMVVGLHAGPALPVDRRLPRLGVFAASGPAHDDSGAVGLGVGGHVPVRVQLPLLLAVSLLHLLRL